MMALAGDVDAATAERWGLVNQVVPPEQLESETMALALRLAQAPTRAIALIKRSLERSFQSDLGDQLELEAHMQQIAGRSEDFREGVSAFLAKRAPHFEGR
jgi:2-(1,2-epoxy-1,2-dihydrophenyl)acetyl-CoA isomerase